MSTRSKRQTRTATDRIIRKPMRCPFTVFGLGTLALVGSTQTALAQFDEYPIGSTAQRFITADFNIDGHQDVAVACGAGLAVLINAGDGTFLAPEIYDGTGSWIQTADLDGDHDFDIVQAGGSRFLVRMNRGDGTFDDAVAYDIGQSIKTMAVGDIDGDGDVDVAMVRPDGFYYALEWHRNDGHGAFTYAQSKTIDDVNKIGKLVAGDFDLDGDADFAVTTRWNDYGYYTEYYYGVHALIGSNEGMNWSVQELYLGERFGFPNDLAVGDLDNDGDFDLVCQRYDYDSGTKAQVLTNNGAGRIGVGAQIFRESFFESEAGRLAVADVDGDGDLDVLSTTFGGFGENTRIRVYQQTSRLNFSRELSLSFSGDLRINDAHYTDINGDGMPDMLLTANNPQSALLVRRNDRPIDRPILDFDPLIRGERTEFRVSNLEPGTAVHIVYSLQPPGSSLGIAALGGATLDLTEPILYLARAEAGSDGVARVMKWVYRTSPNVSVTVQAVQRRPGQRAIKSTFVSAPVVD